MKKIFLLQMIIWLLVPVQDMQSCSLYSDQSHCYDWAIVGAGFAGITALAVLIDSGVDPSTVAWLDPEFNVGRVGKYYREVPGNVQTQHLTEFVENCPLFKTITSDALNKLYTYPVEQFQPLKVIVDPLLDFTAYLQSMVTPIQNCATSLLRTDYGWRVQHSGGIINAKKVILAIGAEPKILNYNIPIIPLDDALNKNSLAQHVSCDDTVAVFGAMHSAMLVLKYLTKCCVKKMVNFYLEDYFIGSPGLEGATAEWVQEVLEKNPPANLIRVLSTAENRATFLPECTKAVYAIGYETRKLLINDSYDIMFDEYTGIIDENLYGIGIAFPPTALFNGMRIAKNGLYAYLVYAKKLVPRWISNDKSYRIEDNDIEIPWI
jgi:hypothetical protein